MATALMLLLAQGGKAQEIEPDPSLSNPQGTFQGKVRDEQAGGSEKKITIQASVQTLEAAIQSEKDVVDWYAWYLSARKYIASRGGIACPAGTMLKFPKKGFVEVKMSPWDPVEPRCVMSIQGMYFPLPEKTRLEAVLLPVRSSLLPPAPPSEIYQRTKGFQ
ncbi:MAG: hypothetical protein VKJ04_10405 [Vampirovibrionales bacterium]|nr:hypothetical protein [Vampirovibrionales bacterium]